MGFSPGVCHIFSPYQFSEIWSFTCWEMNVQLETVQTFLIFISRLLDRAQQNAGWGYVLPHCETLQNDVPRSLDNGEKPLCSLPKCWVLSLISQSPKCLSTDRMAWLLVSEIPYWRISSQMEVQSCPSGRLSAHTPSSNLLGFHETSMSSSEFCFLKLYHLSQIRVGVSCQVSPSVLCYFPCCCWVK